MEKPPYGLARIKELAGIISRVLSSHAKPFFQNYPGLHLKIIPQRGSPRTTTEQTALQTQLGAKDLLFACLVPCVFALITVQTRLSSLD
jgi:hypothetical protein